MKDFFTITNGSIAFIILVFLLFMWQALKLLSVYKGINKAKGAENALEKLGKTSFQSIVAAYEKTINIVTPDGKKSNVPASEYFTEFSTSKAKGLNLRLLDTGGGTLVGLGLLGTFLGLTIGIQGFSSSSTANIQTSIEKLLAGMGTAFSTSLWGMFLSLVFITVDKLLRHRVAKGVYDLNERLDAQYYIDDVSLSSLRHKGMLDELFASIKQMIEQESLHQVTTIKDLSTSINSQLTYSDEEDNKSTVGNALREILNENQQQSKALCSFSTDLAIELNTGFDEVLSRQMQERIVPLMENVDTTTRVIVEHIDQMAVAVSSPATDMLQVVVLELKTSMSSIVDEFRTGLSGSATSELEKLAESLGTATLAMGNFPSDMENISSTLKVTIEEVKNTIAEISNTSANANSTAMHQMQEQITMATTSISNTINQVRDVMSGLTTTSQKQSNQMISKLSDAADRMGTFLDNTVSSLSSSIQTSVYSMTEEVSNKQASLIALQEDSTEKTKLLLNSFNEGLDRLERMNEYITGTMNQFQQAQGEITGSTAHLQTITNDMKLATELFHKGQKDYATTLSSLQNNSQRSIDTIAGLLRQSGEMSSQYVSEFDLIKQGLAAIFGELQKGLTEYSRTVKASTQEYLDKYSTSLTNTTDALSSTIQQQNEVVEMLVESLNAHKHS